MFQLDHFNMADMTSAFNALPPVFGRLVKSGIFDERYLTTTTAIVERINGTLAVLPSQDWQSNGVDVLGDERETITVPIRKTEAKITLMAYELAGLRAFGSDSELESFQAELMRRMIKARRIQDITMEYRMAGALQGTVYDKPSGRVMLSEYSAFGGSQKTVDFKLGTDTTDILSKCYEVKDHVLDNLGDDVADGVRVLVEPTLYRKFISHKNVQKVYEGWSAASDRIGGDMRSGFPFGGLVFEEYSAYLGSTSFMASGTGIAFPTGTVETFSVHYAPASFVEAVNTRAVKFYAKSKQLDFDEGVTIKIQSNGLPLCQRPACLVKIHSSN